jgi:phosphoesterase RecJ-like protein
MIKIPDSDILRLKNLTEKAGNIVIITHHNPDGDAIGSALGLYHVLKMLNKSVSVLLPNHMPEFLQWMPGVPDIVYYKDNAENACRLLKQSDLVFMLDFNTGNRLGKMEECLQHITSPVILIDHHPGPEIKAEITVSFTEVSSTAELVYEVIEASGWSDKINFDSSTCLYTGILTDTISFSVNSSRSRTFDIVSALLGFDINKDEIYRLVFNTYSENRMRLMGHLLSSNMVVRHEYRTAYLTLSLEEARKYHFKTGDSEGFVNYPLYIKGIIFSAFIMERKDHIKLSFRSRGSFAVNKVMEEHFTGGGHVNAAGGEVYGKTIQEVVDKLVAVLPLYNELCGS